MVGILTSIDGIKSSISDSFSDLGSDIYTIESERNNRGRSSGIRKKNQPPIKYRETKEFKKKYEGVGLATVSTVVTGSAELKYKFIDWLWSTNLFLIIAKSIRDFCGISQTVLYLY